MIKRSKTNTTYFQDIPSPKQIHLSREDHTQKILLMLKSKYDLKEERTELVREARELRERIYNMSKAINKLEGEIDMILVKHVHAGGEVK